MKWKYCLLLLILLKVFKNDGMETSYFIKMFYLKKYDFYIQRMNKQKLVEKIKHREKVLK